MRIRERYTVSSRIIPENNGGRTGMGFEASEVMRELDGQRVMREVDAQRVIREVDAQRVLRDSSHVASVSNVLRQYKQLTRDLSGIDRTRQYKQLARDLSGMDWMRRSIQGSMVPAIGDVRAAEKISRTGVYDSLAGLISARHLASLTVSHVAPESARRRLPGLARNLAGLSDYPRLQSDVLKQGRMLASVVGLSGSIAQAFDAHGLDSANLAAWILRSVQPVRTPALRSVLKSATTFGPIVVSPDYEDDAPFDYHPDLGRLLPETATESGGATEVEELWAEVVAFAQGIAHHHRTEVFLSVMTNGTRFVIRVSKHPIVAGTVAGTVGSAAGGIVSGDVVTGAVSGGVSGGVSALLTYLLTRR
jgi:hypothetical protein